ncbi:hypothetical protein ACJ72_08757 [Emergomyces africanus]|uniref:Uncharacterized protein n=1 Tax=Emergomyces africanus TaxID=1955775 RepID=A0A1B7NJV5_9EURO|nr:hypothetical protein ACJ72_08757 [Emergomyces africanus]
MSLTTIDIEKMIKLVLKNAVTVNKNLSDCQFKQPTDKDDRTQHYQTQTLDH